MTTISHNRKGRRTPLTVFLLLLAAVVFLAIIFLRASFSGLVLRVFSPVLSGSNAFGTGVKELLSGFQNKGALVAENFLLERELASTTALLADRNALYAENLSLKALLGRSGGHSRILAGVLLRPPVLPYDTLLLDVGSRDGVVVGRKVANGNTVIGTVSEVYATTARVALFSGPGTQFQAILSSHAGSVAFSMVGQGAGSLMGEVPSQTVVSIGDNVKLAGVEGGFVGAVSLVSQEPNSSFKTIYVQLPENLFSMPYVLLWKD